MDQNLTDDEIKTRIASKVKKLYAKKKKKYTCEFCGTGFDKRDFLISHMKIRHPEDYDLKYGETNYAQLSPNLLKQMAPKKEPVVQSASPSVSAPAPAVAARNVLQPQTRVPQMDDAAQGNGLGQGAPTMRPPMPAPPLIRPMTSSSASQSPGQAAQNIAMNAVNIDFTQQTIPPVSMAELSVKLDQINNGMGRTVKIMNDNMNVLNKELRYLICEYKSPFIIFD